MARKAASMQAVVKKLRRMSALPDGDAQRDMTQNWLCSLPACDVRQVRWVGW